MAEDNDARVADAQEVEQISWYHSIDLGNGIVTNGRKDFSTCLAEADVVFDHDVSGKSVLDIGAWSGFFSFEADRRGAAEVLSTDSFAWEQLGGRPGFDYARSVLAPGIKDQFIDIMDLSSEKVGQFDVVLFLGVLYHMRHPMLALEIVSEVCKEHLVVETHMGCTHLDYPAAEFYPTDELGSDPSNWWGMNEPAIIGMLKSNGFETVEYVPHPIANWAPTRGFFHAFK
ncbi:MAG: DUF1698 domain-containing protein [Pseudomonadota bacterium]